MEFHSIIKKGTSDDSCGFRGCYKKIPNNILGTSRKVAQPYEVDGCINILLSSYYSFKTISIQELAYFHMNFESIHPFQDGNGRIGRFLLLKQCIENNIQPILITSSNSAGYKKAMQGNEKTLADFLNKCTKYTI